MLEVTSSPELGNVPLPVSFGDRHAAPAKTPSRHQMTHWTRHLHDPLGAALLALRKTRTTLEKVDASSSCWIDQTETSDAKNDLQVSVAESEPEVLPLNGLQIFSHESTVVPPEDRRRFPRRQSECSVSVLERRQTDQLTPHQIDRWLQAGRSVGRLLDISQTGLCLSLDREISKDAEVLLRITNSQLNRHVDCTAKVVHSQLTGQGRFSIHCLAVTEFSLSELQDLGRPVAVGHVLA